LKNNIKNPAATIQAMITELDNIDADVQLHHCLDIFEGSDKILMISSLSKGMLILNKFNHLPICSQNFE
jgi:hypothetical protein